MRYQLVYNILSGVSIFLRVINYAILGYCLCSWILPPTNRIYALLRNLSWPFIAPFRGLSMKLMYRFGLRLDLSPWFAIMALQVANSLLWRLFPLLV